MALKGVRQSKEHVRKRSLALTGRELSSSHRKCLLGRKYSSSHCEKIRKSMLGKKHHLGKKHSDEARKKISNANLQRDPMDLYKNLGEVRKGKKHWNWKGGITNTWKKRNKDKVNFSTKKRIRAKKSNGGTHTLEQWQELKKNFNYMCLCCKRFEPEILLSEDHILPLFLGGDDNIENIQPLCKSCNSRKGMKKIDYISQFHEVNLLTD